MPRQLPPPAPASIPAFARARFASGCLAAFVATLAAAAGGCAKSEPLRPVVRVPDAAPEARPPMDAIASLPPVEMDAGDADGGGDGGPGSMPEPVPPGVLSDSSCAGVKGQPANAGCSFWPLQMTSSAAWDGACFAVALVNPTTRPAKLKLEREGMTFSLAKVARVPKGTGRDLTYEPFDEAAGLPRRGLGVS